MSARVISALVALGITSVMGVTTDYITKCSAELTEDSLLRRGVLIGQASLFFLVGVFFWTRFPDPHLKDERLAVFSMCMSLNGYIMLFSGFFNLVGLSQIDDFVLEDCVKIDAARAFQWAVSCPLLTWQISLLARGKKQRQIEVVLSTFFCLLLGLFSTIAPERTYRYLYFAASTVFYILLIVNLDWAIRETTENRESLLKGESHLRKIVLCVSATWTVFPIVWLLGPLGTAAVTDDAILIVTTVIDISAKLLLAFYVYFVRSEWQRMLQVDEEVAKADPSHARRHKRAKSLVTGNKPGGGKGTSDEASAYRAATLARLAAEGQEQSSAEMHGGDVEKGLIREDSALYATPDGTKRSSILKASPASGRVQLQREREKGVGEKAGGSDGIAHQVVINNLFDAQALLQALRKAEAAAIGEAPPVFNTDASSRVNSKRGVGVGLSGMREEGGGDQGARTVPTMLGGVGGRLSTD
uniref:Uncharacterized protein n=1 Tax=Chromera velia CCMP2878 TaxID=1169474 RepID=A0A0G4IEQ8_9ALVE|eukprot:Cvel_13779.t1-p1 / transcript=Cvel_13779.t1 / gene=Cvel_13779 / organism=Chromera_velia_CCMP2878 / gene_product=Archaerhodopsin-1, putative / transcript_product=Archaerhodopsin-1, putative / location=Cvel_scaffold954:56451-60541(-) / protein_length=470 / sequence_SO=supercontig / SO=protein_coding / is_pseudo=false